MCNQGARKQVMPPQVEVVSPADPRGCLIMFEGLGLGITGGGYLWLAVHPVAGIVGGFATMVLYAFGYAVPILKWVLATVASLTWAALAVFLVISLDGDVVWQAFVGLVVFGFSGLLHWLGIQKFEDD